MAIAGQLSDFRHGTNGALTTLTDFTAKTLGVSLSIEGEEVDATTFGNVYRDFEGSFIGGSFSVTYKYDATIFGQLGAIMTNRDSIDFQWSPDGTASGKPKVTGAMVMTSLNNDASVGDLLQIECEFRINGAITFGTH
jgi:hypothetical protein